MDFIVSIALICLIYYGVYRMVGKGKVTKEYRYPSPVKRNV